MISDWSSMGFHGFSWFFDGFSGFLMVFRGFRVRVPV